MTVLTKAKSLVILLFISEQSIRNVNTEKNGENLLDGTSDK